MERAALLGEIDTIPRLLESADVRPPGSPRAIDALNSSSAASVAAALTMWARWSRTTVRD
jgi:hypothetical protein